MVINGVGSAVRVLGLFMNQTLVVLTVGMVRQHIYLPTSFVADCFLADAFGTNITFAC